MALRVAVTAWGLKDTSSRPPKDLGGTLRRTSKTTLRSYDSRASGDQKCPHRQGCVANVANNNQLNQDSCIYFLLAITFTYQDEYQKAIQLIQLAEQTSQRKVG